MANEQISQFTAGTTPLGTDYVGGYLGAAAGMAGGNRRWAYSQIATYIKTAIASTSLASGVVARDASENVFFNNFITGYATTATAAGTTTLTVASARTQFFTGATTQTVALPVTSTLNLGFSFIIVNNSSGIVTVQSSGANAILAMPANTMAIFQCILTSGTGTASWNAKYNGFADITGTGTNVLNTSPTLVTPTLGAALATSINALPLVSPSVDSGAGSIAIGYQAMQNFPASATYFNIALGYQAMQGTVSTTVDAVSNVAIGYQAMQGVTIGQTNMAIGAYAMQLVTTGNNNMALGYASLGDNLTTGSGNTMVGAFSGLNVNGDNNTFIGFDVAVGDAVTEKTGSGNILIGCSSSLDLPSVSTSNYFAVGNSATPVISATGINGVPVITFGGSIKGVTMNAVANTVVLKQGANGKTGTFTANGVTPVTVTNSSITTNSGIIFTLKTVGGSVGAYPAIQTITPTTGFTVAATVGDTSVYNYHIIESAA